jgi:hypothetical protein
MNDPQGPRLVVVTERDHRFVDLGDAECVVGRAPENAIVLKDDMVSRRHCVIERTTSGWRVRDLKSFNGTYLNGERVTDEVLKPWDSLRIGRTRIFFVEPFGQLPGAPPPLESSAAPPPVRAGNGGADHRGAAVHAATIPAEARLEQLMADVGSRAVIEDMVRRERAELERQIGRRLRDESAPVTTPLAGGFAARARRIGPLDGGGDFYDVLVDDRDPDVLNVVVGSVSGQGIAASVAAAVARYLTRGVVLAGTGELLERLMRLRDLLVQTLHPGTATSVILARGGAGGQVRLAGIGGAGAIVFRGPTSEVELVRPVGRRDEAACQPSALDVALGPEDRLLLASDGAAHIRAPGGGEPSGEVRLAESFRTSSTKSPSESLGRLMDGLIAHGGGSADRDATLALLTRV